ncbi:MAG: hypothetical protein ACI87E_002455 [Mariniblastus sp.]|jgi:hypothetical protein
MNQNRCDGLERRELLRVGGLSALGLGIGSFLNLKSAQASFATPIAPTAKSCILIWLDGGPSHLETFDPKPEAAQEVRGPLQSISTSIPGIRLNECFPQTAKRMQDVAIIRSMTSPLGEHNFGTHYMQTGFKPSTALAYPSFHSVGASVYDHVSSLPPNIAIPEFKVGGSSFSGNGFLDRKFAPFSLGGDPSKKGFQVRDLDLYQGLTLDQLQRRNQFVKELDRFSGLADGPSDSGFEQAFNLVTSPKAKLAFDLSQESTQTRQKYGNRTVGQSCLLARRLVEHGVPFVTVNHKGWDTHADLQTRIKDGFSGAQTPVGLAPTLDLAFAGLLDDLKDRRLLDETLVVVMGEFGRTPKLNATGGRDHWPRVFSVMLAGGGIQGGQVVGSSDEVGESPRDRPVTPSDLVATIYRLLGIDPALELKTADGRPIRITPHESKIIDELVG